MTCRHNYGDPSCSSYQSHVEQAKKLIAADSPDSSKYEVLAAHRDGPHLVLKVKYPNCEKCSYELSR